MGSDASNPSKPFTLEAIAETAAQNAERAAAIDRLLNAVDPLVLTQKMESIGRVPLRQLNDRIIAAGIQGDLPSVSVSVNGWSQSCHEGVEHVAYPSIRSREGLGLTIGYFDGQSGHNSRIEEILQEANHFRQLSGCNAREVAEILDALPYLLEELRLATGGAVAWLATGTPVEKWFTRDQFPTYESIAREILNGGDADTNSRADNSADKSKKIQRRQSVSKTARYVRFQSLISLPQNAEKTQKQLAEELLRLSGPKRDSFLRGFRRWAARTKKQP